MRVEGIEALDKAVASVQRGLKLVLDPRIVEANARALAEIKTRLKPGKGEIRFVLRLGDRGREVELGAAARYDVSPAMAGMLSTLPGVSEVLEI